MKPPPFLLGLVLLFWGWQIDSPLAGALLALIIESPRWLRPRWELSNDDFARIWTFCALLVLGSLLFAFTTNEGASEMSRFLKDPNLATGRNVGNATSRAFLSWMRWLPMVLAPFVAAQRFSSRDGIPLETISLILRARWKMARKLGQPVPASRIVDVAYPYFALCLFSASVHPGDNTDYFWGSCALLAWALWPRRAGRFPPFVWSATLLSAVALGYLGQGGIGRLQRYLDNINPQWLLFWTGDKFDPTRSKTALGQIGRVQNSSRIVVRLDTLMGPAPQFLHEASYRVFKAQTWYSEQPDLRDFDEVKEAPPQTYVLAPGKSVPASVQIACYLDGQTLLPLPPGCGRLEKLFTFSLHKSLLGAVVAEGPSLVIFDARFGPSPCIESSPGTNQDLAVPEREAFALNQVIANLQLAGKGEAEVLRTVQQFFQEKFTYHIWRGPQRLSGTNDTPLADFLLHSRKGHCEYFATATVLLLRQLQIPARYAVGYSVHEGSGGHFVVRQRDSHAWCRVWDRQKSVWRDFDTTPVSWVGVEAERASPWQKLGDCWSWLWFEISQFRYGQGHFREYLLWALLPVLALLLYQIIFRARRRRPDPAAGDSKPGPARPGLDSEFYELERTLLARGYSRRASEPLSHWLARAAADPALAALRAPLRELLRLHYRYRFDPQGLPAADRQHLRIEARAQLAALGKP